MTAVRRAPIAAALLLAACGGVSSKLRTDVPAPATIAVLPIGGDEAPVGLRDACRQLLHSRLVARGYRAPELSWVDRVLSEHGWMQDPERFALDPEQLPAILKALDADAAVLCEDFDESSFNVLLLRRHAVGGRVAMRYPDGREYWSSDHSAVAFGGFLITSGQVIAELRAQGEHGTPMASLALADEFTADVVGTVPERELAPPEQPAPVVGNVETWREKAPDGGQRVVVKARANPGCELRFELAPLVAGVPMVAMPGDAERYLGQHDVPATASPQRLVVRARDAFGRESVAEVAL